MSEVSQECKQMMDELIGVEEEIQGVKKTLKPLREQLKALNHQKSQHLSDILSELDGNVITYRNHLFGSQKVGKTIYGKKQIEDYLNDDTKVEEYRTRFTEEKTKPVFQRVKRQRT
jgi:archaellum component FlaC